MRARLLLPLCSILLVLPNFAAAGVDPFCTGSALRVTGSVKDLAGGGIEHIQIDVFASTQSSSVGNGSIGTGYTSPSGGYSVCITVFRGVTYEVQASDPGLASAGRKPGAFETKAQVFDVAGSTLNATNVDFALPYRLFVELSPAVFASATPVVVTVKSTAPPSTSVRGQLYLVNSVLHTETLVGSEFSVPAFGPDPATGSPYYLWKTTLSTTSLSPNVAGTYYLVKTWGRNASQQTITTTDRHKLHFDSPAVDPPQIGVYDPATAKGCNNGVFRLRGSLASDPKTVTTNPRPDVYIGSCDGVSGIAFDSVTLLVDGVAATKGVQVKYINTSNYMDIDYIPPAPGLTLGLHTFKYTVKDNAGNSVTSPQYTLDVRDFGGAPVVIVNPAPKPTHPGLGIPGPAFGFGFADNYPVISCTFADPDGNADIVWGSLSVAVYYNGVIVRRFDPNDPTSPGKWDTETGVFEMRFEYPVTNPPAPGIYTVVASASDHGGNSATLTWQFVLAFAA